MVCKWEFYEDFTRIITRLMLPLSFILAVILSLRRGVKLSRKF
ncbi:potassium-transporting ATPase subunit KdpA [Campylobacter jejuni]|nr:potassium-transporting ATPase subunit KdpA [Campylobacter jejuni]